MSMFALNRFMRATLDYQGGIIPSLDNSMDHFEVAGLLGRPLTLQETASWQRVRDTPFTLTVNPEYVGENLNSLDPKVKLVIAIGDLPLRLEERWIGARGIGGRTYRSD